MAYYDGFLIAVPTANKDKFIAHANLGDAVFMEQGATHIVECWQDDIAKGKHTDFFRAVDAREDEAVVFSWIEWPDREARQQAMGKMDALMKEDDRFSPEKNPMPFDGQRMIFGGFQPILEEGARTPGAYVQGFVVPVPEANKEAYRKLAAGMWPMFRELGALRMVEAWQDDVPKGERTDFFRTVKAEPGESVVFSLIEWPSRAVCDAAGETMRNDERMKPPEGFEMPFDGKRMIWGGFRPIVELAE